MAEPPSSPWQIVPLTSSLVKTDFSCGHPSLDAFLRQFAGQNEKTGVSRTYVAVQPGERIVCGYYSISAGVVHVEAIPDEMRRRLPAYPIPVVHLGRLAVDIGSRGQGLGSRLLIDAFERVLHIREWVGVHAVEVIAIDEAARSFYLKYGFSSMLDDSRHLYLPISTLLKARQ